MIVEKVLGKCPKTNHKRVDVVTLQWYERDKKRMRKQSNTGEEIGIAVEIPLQEGDILAEDEERMIVVTYAPCEIMEIPVATRKEMGRLCFELGNRHLSLEIQEDKVRLPMDEPTFTYLQHLGFCPVKATGKLEHITVCKGHDHSHSHSHSHGKEQENELC